MSYSSIEKRLAEGKIIILDGGIGGELQKVGAKMDEGLWCGRCSLDSPNELLKVHQNYVKAGADVITANTYASTPISMKKYGYETKSTDDIRKLVGKGSDSLIGRSVWGQAKKEFGQINDLRLVYLSLKILLSLQTLN